MIDADENKERLRKIREALLEAIEFTYTQEEQEERKRNATPTEFQTE